MLFYRRTVHELFLWMNEKKILAIKLVLTFLAFIQSFKKICLGFGLVIRIHISVNVPRQSLFSGLDNPIEYLALSYFLCGMSFSRLH